MPGPLDSILETIGRTPVVRINQLAPAHVKLYVKIEAFNPMGSVKDRLALGVIEDAERDGLLPGQTVIEATSGNTGIGLAMVCAQKGYPLVVDDGGELQRRAAQDDALPRREGGAHARGAEGQRHAREGGRARRDARLVPVPPVRERGQRGHALPHHRARDPRATSTGERLDYCVTGYGTGGTLKGVARVLQGASARDTQSWSASPTTRRSSPAASRSRAAPTARRRQPPELPPAPDAGLDARTSSRSSTEDARGDEARRPDPRRSSGADALRCRASSRSGRASSAASPAARRSRARCRCAPSAPPGSTLLCMLPDTGERYLSTPLFADVPREMTDEELAIARSTPNYRFDVAARRPRRPRRRGRAGAREPRGRRRSSTQVVGDRDAAGRDVRARVVRVLLVGAQAVRRVRDPVPLDRPRLGRVPARRPRRQDPRRAPRDASASPTIPQIFVGGELIGGAPSPSMPSRKAACRSCSQPTASRSTAASARRLRVPAELAAPALRRGYSGPSAPEPSSHGSNS